MLLLWYNSFYYETQKLINKNVENVLGKPHGTYFWGNDFPALIVKACSISEFIKLLNYVRKNKIGEGIPFFLIGKTENIQQNILYKEYFLKLCLLRKRKLIDYQAELGRDNMDYI